MQLDSAWLMLVFVVLAALSVAAERRRHRRRESDRTIGRIAVVPWPLITILSLVTAAFCAAAWLRGG